MKGFAMLGMGKTGWIEKARPVCGALDAIVRPIAVSPCTSDVHTVWEGALGERKDLILGHEAVGEVVEVGSLVRDFAPGDRVIVTAITPDWGSEEAQRGFAMHSGGMLAGWKFSNYKDGVFAEFFHVNEADANLAKLPDDLDPGTACMLCDMMPTGFHAAELAEIGFGESVCVIGIGPVGLMAVRACVLRGAGDIFCVGTRKVCMDAAKQYGATDFLSYKNGDLAEQILGRKLGLSDAAFGLWAGTAVNDTSSVVATGYAFSEAAGDFATMVKLTRTLSIIPTVLVFAVISLKLKKKEAAGADASVNVNMKSVFPWFILGFLALSGLTSLGLIPGSVSSALKTLSKFLMVAALGAVGLNTDFKALCKSGAKPMLHGFIISLLVVLVAIGVEYMLGIAPTGNLF